MANASIQLRANVLQAALVAFYGGSDAAAAAVRFVRDKLLASLSASHPVQNLQKKKKAMRQPRLSVSSGGVRFQGSAALAASR